MYFCHLLLFWEIKNLLKLKCTIVHVSVLAAASFLNFKDWVDISVSFMVYEICIIRTEKDEIMK
jgi:hypothetical protein